MITPMIYDLMFADICQTHCGITADLVYKGIPMCSGATRFFFRGLMSVNTHVVVEVRLARRSRNAKS
jgi:hypothetical protein